MKTPTQRSAWKVLFWVAVAGIVEAALVIPDVVEIPVWLSPFIPIIVGVLRFAHVVVKTQSVDISGLPDDLQRRIQAAMDVETKRYVAERAGGDGHPR